MALNWGQMMASLKMGVDVLPETDPEDVPHVKDPSHIPSYSLRSEDGSLVDSGPVDLLVERAHMDFYPVDVLTLFEDDYPVFTIS